MSKQHELGLDRPITRRDFIQGVAVPVGTSLVVPAWVQSLHAAQSFAPEQADDEYPPSRSGMRGSHDGSFEVGHQLRDQRGWDFSGATDTGERYDLVVVGGGISGLAATHFFVKHLGRNARVLILDNHDDFGGHAKRNEFEYNGRTLALNGGTLNIESPERYNQPSQQLLEDVGIDFDRFLSNNTDSQQMYRRMGLGGGYFFDKETWGSDRLVQGGDGRGGSGYDEAFVSQISLSAAARRDMLRLYGTTHPDYLPGLSSAQKKARLATMSYTNFLLEVVQVDPQELWFIQSTGAGSFVTGIDALPALFAWEMEQPGFNGMDLEPTPDGMLANLPGGHDGCQRPGRGSVHFPDGNATLTRLIVRGLLPDAVPGSTQEDVGAARVDYAKLDRPAQPARIRPNSAVVRVRHTGAGASEEVEVSYVRGGRTSHVHGRHVVMACWNMIIPYLVPELPASQKEALAYGVKAPLVYTSVAVKNWTAFEKLGLSRVSSPTMYHARVGLDEAVSLGDLRHAEDPSEPIVLSLGRYSVTPGLPRKEQYRLGREDLLRTPFTTFEKKIRDQLNRELGGGDFDAARDIIAITVNRWPHGYAYTYNSLTDPLERRQLMSTAPSRSRPLTRRGALRLLGGAGVGLLTARCGAPERAAAPLQDERRTPVTFPDGAIIRTVLSDVDPEVLGDGATLFHEHLSLSDPLPPWLPPSDNPLGAFTTDLDLMADEVNATAQEGVSCIVSGGTKDLGQSFERLRTLAGRTDMHIVVASGLWTQPRYPPDIAEKSEDQVAEDFLRDATAERWGAIGEIGSSLTMHPR